MPHDIIHPSPLAFALAVTLVIVLGAALRLWGAARRERRRANIWERAVRANTRRLRAASVIAYERQQAYAHPSTPTENAALVARYEVLDEQATEAEVQLDFAIAARNVA